MQPTVLVSIMIHDMKFKVVLGDKYTASTTTGRPVKSVLIYPLGIVCQCLDVGLYDSFSKSIRNCHLEFKLSGNK